MSRSLKNGIPIGLAVILVLAAHGITRGQIGSSPIGKYVVAEGVVEVESESGAKTAAQGALVEVYSLDWGKHWATRTDSTGHYRILLPNIGSYLMAVSGPGLMPLWDNNVHLKYTPTLNFVTYPGAGNHLGRKEIQERIALGWSARVYEPSIEGRPYTVTLPPERRAEYFRAMRDARASADSVAALKRESDKARDTYNVAVWWKIGGEYQRALDEFDKLLPYDGSKDEYFAKVAREAIVNIAEIHYLWAIKLYDRGSADQARDHFKIAVESGNRYIAWAEAATPGLDEDYKTFLLTTYRIVARSALDLVKFAKNADFKSTALSNADKAAAMDPTHRSEWELLKARVDSSSGDRDEAIRQYKALLASDATNIDGLYEVSLLLLKSQSEQDLTEAAGYLRRFVKLAPAEDDRVSAAKQALQALGPP